MPKKTNWLDFDDEQNIQENNLASAVQKTHTRFSNLSNFSM